MVSSAERVFWALGASTCLVVVCQLLICLLYPLLVCRSSKPSKKLKSFHKSSSNLAPVSSEGLPVVDSTSRSLQSNLSLCIFSCNRLECVALIEVFFLGLAASTLIADALFHLIPEALIYQLETSTVSVNHHHSLAGILSLGFWAIAGMLLVVVIEAIVHSDVSLSSLCCCYQSSQSDKKSSREKVELCSAMVLSPSSSDSPGFPVRHHPQRSDLHSDSSTNDSSHSLCHHDHHDHHHHNYYGSCGDGGCVHGFSHLILESDESNSSSEQENHDQYRYPSVHISSPNNHHQFKKSKRLLSKSSSHPSSPVSSLREQNNDSPPDDQRFNQIQETDDNDPGSASRHRRCNDAVQLMEMERPHALPGTFRFIGTDIVDQNYLLKSTIEANNTNTELKDCQHSYQYCHQKRSDQSTVRKKMLRGSAWANLVAELLHNIVDGLAIGIAFLSGPPSIGIATTIAIFSHEVPTQIAGFIILLRGGFHSVVAYALNFGVAFGIHIGALCALLGTPETYHSAFHMLAAGNFLCLGLSMILPQLREILYIDILHQQNHRDQSNKRRLILGAATGLLGGVGLISLLAFLGM